MNDESSKYRAVQQATHPKAATDAQVVVTCPKCGASSSDEAATRCIPDSSGDNCPGCEEPVASAWDTHPAPSQAVGAVDEALRKLTSKELGEIAYTINRKTATSFPDIKGWMIQEIVNSALINVGPRVRQSTEQAVGDGVVPTPQQISDYLASLDAIQREIVEREARATPRPAVATPAEVADSNPVMPYSGTEAVAMMRTVIEDILSQARGTHETAHDFVSWHLPRVRSLLQWIDAALASPSAGAVVPEGWLPIETAPNDGTMHVRGLHVYGPDGAFLYWDALTGYVDEEDGAFYDMGGDDLAGWGADDFTHWHPLAAAPESGGV